MPFSLTWLADVLRNAGLSVKTIDGWENRGRGEMGEVMGVLCHHTAGPKNGNMPSLDLIIKGREDLPGPLSQLGLGRDGTFFVIAAGRCNHAGKGEFKGITNGNTNLIGIEAENTGLENDSPWPAVQVDAYQRGVAAILKHVGRSSEFCAGHKEYAPKRKTDPSFDMVAFRAGVEAFMSVSAAASAPVSPVESLSESPTSETTATTATTSTTRPTLRRGSVGEFVKELQAKIGVNADGSFGPKTDEAVRAFQQDHNLTADGVVGARTWAALDEA